MKIKRILTAVCLLLSGPLTIFAANMMFPNPPGQPSDKPSTAASGERSEETGKSDIDSITPSSDSQPDVDIVPPEPKTNAQIIQTNSQSPGYVNINNKLYPLRTYKPLALPADPLADQWWVGNANFEQAWATARGSHQTLMAIIDTGFGLAHEEFANRWYQNPGEIGPTSSEAPSSLNCTARGLTINASCNLIDDDFDGMVDNETGPASYENPSRLNCSGQAKPLNKDCNRLDDDNNGWVDDVTGWDFINNDNSVQAGELNPVGSGTTHGTMVAGVAAATGNNNKGIAGADWGTKLLPIQALDDDSYGDTLSVGRSILYAIKQGADVISISLGATAHDPYVLETIEQATAAGIVVVAASGNSGCDCIVYPARYPEVVAVGALDVNNNYASFSSWGQNLDILAPGTQITTPTWTSSNRTSAYAPGVAGTSFATPLTSGIITTLLSHQPNATPLQLIAALTESTNRLNLSATQSHHLRHGFGKIDASKAITRMISERQAEQTYLFQPVRRGNFFSSNPPLELLGTYNVHHCSDSVVASTPIYELSKPDSHFFSISRVEARKAQERGYSATLFSYLCLQQPHDKLGITRNIDIFQEFRNLFSKL